ncbi:PqqD family protein [Novosphingobium sp. ERN07]|nr:PqqD family protein [Novosphingobium sp. ERN07]
MQHKGVIDVELTGSFTLSEDVVAREVGEETMLLDLASGTYFGLNPVGGRFWQLLEEGRSAAEARDCLLDEFEVEADVLDADLSTLLDELAAKGLVATV